MIRIALLDDHPAMRAGLSTVLAVEPGFVPVSAAASAEELWETLDRERPDVLLLDYHLPGGDGLTICRRVKQRGETPRVVIYSAYADASLAVPAILAGADGIAHKAMPAMELYDVLRRVARGERVMPPITRDVLHEAAAKLDPEDQPVLTMLMDATPPSEVADILGVPAEAMGRRIERLIGRLRVRTPAAR